MWLVTTRGFYSAVEHRDDPTKVMVRARARKDLESLAELWSEKVQEVTKSTRQELPDWHGQVKIIDTPPPADYPCRAILDKNVWDLLVMELLKEITYPNFKDGVKETGATNRARTYMSVWSALRKIETENRRPEEYWEPLWQDPQLEFEDEYDGECTCGLGGEPITSVSACPIHGTAPDSELY